MPSNWILPGGYKFRIEKCPRGTPSPKMASAKSTIKGTSTGDCAATKLAKSNQVTAVETTGSPAGGVGTPALEDSSDGAAG